MVNQWGRDGTSGGATGRSGGGAGVVIAAVLALLIGGGAGYGAARFLSGVSASDLASRDQTISELRQQVSKLKQQTSGAQTSDNVLRAQVEELQDQLGQLEKANQTLKQMADEQGSQVNSDAQAEIDALKKTIEEAGDIQGQLSRARKSLKVSELQLIELEGTVTTQQDEIRKLRSDLAKAATQGDAGNKALGDQIKKLESALASANEQASTVPDLKKRIADVEDDLAQKTADASAARKKVGELQQEAAALKARLDKAVKDATEAGGTIAARLMSMRVERDALKEKLAAAEKQLTDLENQSGDAEQIRKDLAGAEEQLAGKDTEISSLKAQTDALRSAVSAAEAKAGRIDSQRILLGTQLAALTTEKEKLETENAGLRQTIANLQAKPTEPENDTPTTPDDSGGATTRDADVVREALADMPGFSRLTAEKQVELAGRLENGECVADALKAALGRVPAIALRNLIRDLGSKC